MKPPSASGSSSAYGCCHSRAKAITTTGKMSIARWSTKWPMLMKGTRKPRLVMAASYLRGLRPSRDRRTIPVENGTEADSRGCLPGGAAPRGRDGARLAAGVRDPLAQPSALPAHLRGARRDDGRHAGGHLDGAAATRGLDAAEDGAPGEDFRRSPHAHALHRARGGEAHAARLRGIRSDAVAS